MTPDASGKFKGISVPSIPWHEKGHGMTRPTTTPSGARIWAEQADGSRTDVTEAVQVAYDLVLSSMDFGSGFLSVEEVIPLSELAQACGFNDEAPRAYIKSVARFLPRSYGLYGPKPKEVEKAQAWLDGQGANPGTSHEPATP